MRERERERGREREEEEKGNKGSSTTQQCSGRERKLRASLCSGRKVARERREKRKERVGEWGH